MHKTIEISKILFRFVNTDMLINKGIANILPISAITEEFPDKKSNVAKKLVNIQPKMEPNDTNITPFKVKLLSLENKRYAIPSVK